MSAKIQIGLKILLREININQNPHNLYDHLNPYIVPHMKIFCPKRVSTEVLDHLSQNELETSVTFCQRPSDSDNAAARWTRHTAIEKSKRQIVDIFLFGPYSLAFLIYFNVCLTKNLRFS